MPEAYYEQYKTGRNQIVKDLNEKINLAVHSGHEITEDFLLLAAARIAEQNVNKDRRGTASFDNIEGGPFGAVIVRYEGGLDKNGKGIGKPEVIGIGANHVVLEADPSAHAEMSAIRDATKRLGHSDLSGTVMFSSCECCPQCQASVTGTGIKRVYFANTRQQAHDIGFSDEEQYQHMQNIDASMTPIDRLKEEEKTHLLEKLGTSGAIILDEKNNVVSRADINLRSEDPTASLPSMNVIRAACKEMQKRGNKKAFHLPESYRLITRNKPHPAAFTTADWARIGRIRGTDPENPAQDAFKKDPACIVYVESEFEQMHVRDCDGTIKTLAKASDILADINTTPENRTWVKTEQTANPRVLKMAEAAFNLWKALTGIDGRAAY